MPDLGTYLVSGREQAGMSASDVSSVTRIPVKAVQALEQERWKDLPEAAFVRGFVVNYCRSVGLDDGPALETLATVVRYRRQTEKAHPVPEPGPTNILVSSGRSSVLSWTYLAIGLVFAVGILIAVLLVGTGGSQDVTQVQGGPATNQSAPANRPHG